jgi:hypothetical protein
VSPREVRQAKNQALFRSVNDRIAELSERFNDDQDLQLICECATEGCTERLEVPLHEYARVRRCPDWFLITPGHIFSDAEHVIEHHDGYDIVKTWS